MQREPNANRDDMIRRWQGLAEDIAADPGTQDSGSKGSLVVIGSGLAFTDFVADAEPLIRAADHVFHCLYDRVSEVWLNCLRPDALDLRILYSPGTDRYLTYVRMAEAVLFHVRRGKNVVAIYYGHPGIFATPAHRAIEIARREGHRAKMRPGISALDYLIADVGFDPVAPGLASFEATDLLLRRRNIDPSLHIVLWQVGVTGEFQFSPEGFENRGFDMLLDELQAIYGRSWQIVHYLAPQYIGVDPLIERFTVDQLRSSDIRGRVGALSTFYIPPQLAVATDSERSVELGYTRPGQYLGEAQSSYPIASYGPMEVEAIAAFGDFRPPEHFRVATETPATRFMLRLSLDIALRNRFRHDPHATLAEPEFADLNDRARRLLMIPHPLAINAALAETAAG